MFLRNYGTEIITQRIEDIEDYPDTYRDSFILSIIKPSGKTIYIRCNSQDQCLDAIEFDSKNSESLTIYGIYLEHHQSGVRVPVVKFVKSRSGKVVLYRR